MLQVTGAVFVISYGALKAIAVFFRAVFAYPVAAIALFFVLVSVQKCRAHYDMGGINVPALMGSSEATVRQQIGVASSCSNAMGVVSCVYPDLSVSFARDRVTSVHYKGLDGKPFDNKQKFYKHVLGMLDIPYRNPDYASIDRVVWRVPGVGVITASSNDRMEVAGVTIDG